MSYHLPDGSYHQLTQARDTLRLLKHATQGAEVDSTIETALLASYLTLIDEQVSVVLDALEHSQ